MSKPKRTRHRPYSILNGMDLRLDDVNRTLATCLTDSREEDQVAQFQVASPGMPCTLGEATGAISVDDDGGVGYESIAVIGLVRMWRENLIQAMLPIFVPEAFKGSIVDHVPADVREMVAAIREHEKVVGPIRRQALRGIAA